MSAAIDGPPVGAFPRRREVQYVRWQWSAEQTARLLALAPGTRRPVFEALADTPLFSDRSWRVIYDRFRWLQKRRRSDSGAPVGEYSDQPKVEGEQVERRCCACGDHFSAPSRFRFRCDACLHLHAQWRGMDA